MIQEKCICQLIKPNCSVCANGYHIFCNHIPHGTEEQAYQWFILHPEHTKNIKPIGYHPAYEKAIAFIKQNEENETEIGNVGKIIRPHPGSLCDCRQPEHQHNMCNECGATFTMKNYANAGDDLTQECSICQAVKRAYETNNEEKQKK